jgi:hypothetical protein
MLRIRRRYLFGRALADTDDGLLKRNTRLAAEAGHFTVSC